VSKITRLEILHVRPRFSFLVLHTDEGLTGVGEAALEGRDKVVEAALREFEYLLIGADSRRIEHLWLLMYRATFYPPGSVIGSAISAIDQALWDLQGKRLGVPVHELLGGRVRDRARVYKHVNTQEIGMTEPFERQESDLEELLDKAREAVAEGYTMIKTALPGPARFLESRRFIEKVSERYLRLREVIGADIDFGIDFHGRVSAPLAVQLIKEIEPANPMFIEEPVTPEDVDAMSYVSRRTAVPIAAGERLFTRWGFQRLLEERAVSIVQPDLAHAGGITEGRKIAALSETYGVGFAPHNPLGPVNLAAALHLSFTVENFVAQEQITLGEDLITQPFELVDGYVAAPDKPGLGVELDRETFDPDLYDGDWKLPYWFDAHDGGVAKW
jgi:galactonate dehydratase